MRWRIGVWAGAMILGGCDGDDKAAAPVCADTPWTSVSAGRNLACGVHEDGCVACWGNENLGGGGWVDTKDDVPPDAAFSRVAVDLGDDGFEAGGFTTCGLTTSREVRCWGRALTETGVAIGEALDISVAGEVCAIGVQGGVTCWGGGTAEELDVPGGRWLDVDSSTVALVNCALGSDAQIRCWGFCDEVMCAPPEGSFVALDLGVEHGCALDADGAVLCWGGYGETAESPPAEERFSQVSAGSASCGVRKDSSLLCWGARAGAAILSPPAGAFKQVDVGDGYACAVSMTGEIYCWGDMAHGQDGVPG